MLSTKPFHSFQDLTTNPESPQLVLKTTLENPHGVQDVNVVAWGVTEGLKVVLATGGDDGVVRIWKYVD